MKRMAAELETGGSPKPNLDRWKDGCATIAAVGYADDERFMTLLRMISLDSSDLVQEFPVERRLKGGAMEKSTWIKLTFGVLLVLALFLALYRHFISSPLVGLVIEYDIHGQLLRSFQYFLGMLSKLAASMNITTGISETLSSLPTIASETMQLTTLRRTVESMMAAFTVNASWTDSFCDASGIFEGDPLEVRDMAGSMTMLENAATTINNPSIYNVVNTVTSVISQQITGDAVDAGSFLDSGIDTALGRIDNCFERGFARFAIRLWILKNGIKTPGTNYEVADASKGNIEALRAMTEFLIFSSYLALAIKFITYTARTVRRRMASRSTSKSASESGEEGDGHLIIGNDGAEGLTIADKSKSIISIKSKMRILPYLAQWLVDLCQLITFTAALPVFIKVGLFSAVSTGRVLTTSPISVFLNILPFLGVIVTLQYLFVQYRYLAFFSHNIAGVPSTLVGEFVRGQVSLQLNELVTGPERLLLDGADYSAGLLPPYAGRGLAKKVSRSFIRFHEWSRGYQKTSDGRFLRLEEQSSLVSTIVNKLGDVFQGKSTSSLSLLDGSNQACLVLSPDGSGDVVQEVCEIVDDIGKLLGTEAAGSGVRDAVSSDDPCGDLCGLVGDIERLLDAI